MPISKIIVYPAPFCPLCGGRMRLRRPRPGQTFDPFWSCVYYSDCKGKRGIRPDGKPEGDDLHANRTPTR